jgi:hypothetical protein
MVSRLTALGDQTMQEIPMVPQPPQPPMYQQQPSMYPPPTYQPPQKPPHSRKRLWLIIGIIATVLVIGVIGASMTASGGQQTTTPQATQSVQQATTQPSQPTVTKAPQAHTIGKPVQVGDTWVVTVNSVKTNTGSDFTRPKSGYTYLIVDVTLKNISSSNHVASSIMMFDLKDQTGQKYTITFTDFAKAAPDGTMSSGSLLPGELVYEVPSSMHAFTFSFQPSIWQQTWWSGM